VRRAGQVLFWSVLSAAFIGPGTVTTAASAGASHGLALLWALTFSTFACVVLQEGVARLTAGSGRTLGEALCAHVGRGPAVAIVTAVVLGCAAYEAGNILGGVAGLQLGWGVPRDAATLGLGLLAAALLATATTQGVARILGGVVAVMGGVFLAAAIRIAPVPLDVLEGAVLAQVPTGSLGLVLGLIGTTVVPYNLFLGSGLARGRDPAHLRFGIVTSVVLGGIVSGAVLVTGTAIEGTMDFPRLAAVLDQRLGLGVVVAIGLFAAGASSAITAPWAAAFAAESVLPGLRRHRAWVWGGVLAVGVAFGLADVRPIPMILLAQMLNGLLLPLVTTFLLWTLNARDLLGDRVNGPRANAAGGVVWAVSLLLGTSGVLRGGAAALGLDPPAPQRILAVAAGITLVAVVPLVRGLRRAGRVGAG